MGLPVIKSAAKLYPDERLREQKVRADKMHLKTHFISSDFLISESFRLDPARPTA